MWQQHCSNSPTSILCWPSSAPDSCTSGGSRCNPPTGPMHTLRPGCKQLELWISPTFDPSGQLGDRMSQAGEHSSDYVSIGSPHQETCGFWLIYWTTDADQCLLWLDWHPHLSCSQYWNNTKAFMSLGLLVLSGYNIITTQWHLLTCLSWVRSLPPTQYDISASLHIGNIKSKSRKRLTFPPLFVSYKCTHCASPSAGKSTSDAS